MQDLLVWVLGIIAPQQHSCTWFLGDPNANMGGS